MFQTKQKLYQCFLLTAGAHTHHIEVEPKKDCHNIGATVHQVGICWGKNVHNNYVNNMPNMSQSLPLPYDYARISASTASQSTNTLQPDKPQHPSTDLCSKLYLVCDAFIPVSSSYLMLLYLFIYKLQSLPPNYALLTQSEAKLSF